MRGGSIDEYIQQWDVIKKSDQSYVECVKFYGVDPWYHEAVHMVHMVIQQRIWS